MPTDGYVQIIWDAPEWNPWGFRLVVHDVSTTPPVLAAELAQAWADIQRSHAELPDLAAPESLIGESSSACGAELSFERLLHEAVHGIAAARGVRDTSRAGRYHNRRFLAIAEEMGLDHPEEPHPSSGFSLVSLSPEAKRRYRPTIERLQRALKAHTVATASDTKRSFRGLPPGTARPEAGCASKRSATAVGTYGSFRRSSPRRRSSAGAAASPSVSRKWSPPRAEACRAETHLGPVRRIFASQGRSAGQDPAPGGLRTAAGDRPGHIPPRGCGRMASRTRQSHRTPLSSG